MLALDKKFTWLPRKVTIEVERKDYIEKEDIVLICIRNNITGITLPHPISDFIKKIFLNWGLDYDTQMRAARVVTQFFNFIFSNIEDDIEDYQDISIAGLKKLKRKHACDFITYGTVLKKNNSGTIAYWESVLNDLYIFLKERNILEEDFKLPPVIKSRKKKRPIYASIFSNSIFDIERPNPNKDEEMQTLKDFGDYRYELVRLFIEEARMYAPEIALGICFQILGGLRVGEVVNITEGNVYSNGLRGERGFWVKVNDNQTLLFNHLVSGIEYCQVKRPRFQSIIEDEILKEVYEEHMDKLYKQKAEGKVKIKNSLFVSRKTGMPICGRNYKKKFDRIKKRFLEKLKAKRWNDEVEFLESLPWSTHICRGIFTNFLIDLGLSLSEIRDLRGDRSFTAAFFYLEKRNAVKRVNQLVDKLSDVYGEGEDVEMDEIERLNKLNLYNISLGKWRGFR